MQHISPQHDPGTFETFQLSNGITVYHRPAPQLFGLPKIACSLLVNAGARDDAFGKEGSAHFFEHMPFRGTENFPSLEALTQEIENNGGYINAFTTDEVTGYEIIVPSELLDAGMQRLADMLLNPLMREADIEIERNVISEELRNKLSSVGVYAREQLYKGLLGSHPVVHSVVGTEEALRAIQKDDLLAFHVTYYNASNVSLFFAGTYEESQLRQLCESYFGTIVGGKKTERNLPVSPSKIASYTETFEPERYNRSLYIVGRVLPIMNLEDGIKMRIFLDMLARGMNSPLHQEIREKRGLAYNLNASHSTFSDLGLLSFSVSTQFQQMDEVDEILWREVHKILNNEQRFKEVTFAVKQALLHREFSVASLVDGAIDLYLDYGRILTLNEYITTLEKITLASVKAFVEPLLEKDYFLNVRINCDRKMQER